MPSEHEFTHGANPLLGDQDQMWTARDEQSAEDEVAEFMGAIVRLLKPQFIVETGCYLGDSTISMAKALKKNGSGRLLSCDIEKKRVDEVNAWLEKEELYPEIGAVLQCKGIDLIKQCGSQIDFAFIDSSPKASERGEEIEELLKYLRPLKMFALHDTAPQHQGGYEVANKLNLPKLYFNCPRGLTLFQKLIWKKEN